MKNSAIDHAFEKLDEADFFLSLLTVVTTEHKPLPTPSLTTISPNGGIKKIKDRFSVESQVAYLLSAFSNACYSAVEFIRRDKELVKAAKIFCAEHPVFYASGPDGGIRTLNTHFKIVKTSTRLDVRRSSPNPFDSEEFDDIFNNAKLVPIEEVPIRCRTDYYLSDASPQDSVGLICSVHHMDLTNFLNECRRKKSDA